jgi:predicted ATPase with chaperone activity
MRMPTTESQFADTEDGPVPAAPLTSRDTGIDGVTLSDLALRLAYTVSQFNTEWAARRLHLPQALVGELLEGLRTELLLEVLGEAGPFGYRYSMSGRGRERASRLFDTCGYVGPAPVSLAAYTEMIHWQTDRAPVISPAQVRGVLDELVLPEQVLELAGLAVSSGRSLFLHGPPGNGKTSLSIALHRALKGEFWIPHAITVEGTIIRVFDAQCHQPVEISAAASRAADGRWIRIRRPLIVVGTELTLESFELLHSPSTLYYQAPLHIKANGGTLLVDDFGRQRASIKELLNRWIIPLEHRIDYLTLASGQKIQVPFLPMIILSTNLDPATVTDPAFLRRMGYRMCLDQPSPGRYAKIFENYTTRQGVSVEPGLVARVLARYAAEGRELRGCEPRDLVERARDICRFRGRQLELNDEILDLAWNGYFGADPSA